MAVMIHTGGPEVYENITFTRDIKFVPATGRLGGKSLARRCEGIILQDLKREEKHSYVNACKDHLVNMAKHSFPKCIGCSSLTMRHQESAVDFSLTMSLYCNKGNDFRIKCDDGTIVVRQGSTWVEEVFTYKDEDSISKYWETEKSFDLIPVTAKFKPVDTRPKDVPRTEIKSDIW